MVSVCGRNFKVQGRLIRVARVDGDKYRFLSDPEPVLDGLRECGVRIDLFTFMQRLPETTPKYEYPMEWDNLAALPVSTFDHWWTKQIDNKTRNMVRKAEKRAVVVREVPFNDGLVRGIWEIYNECPVRQGTRNMHYGKSIETVSCEEATHPDCSVFIGAFLDGSLIGFVKLVHDETGTQAGMMNIVSMIRHRDRAPTNALIAQAVRSCAERRISYLVYSNFAYGRKQRDNLSDFKQRNGFQRIDLPRYYCALTGAGRLAFQLRLHHGLVDLVPEAIAAKLRDLRKAWYERRFHRSVTEASLEG